MDVKAHLQQDMKNALKGGDKVRLGTIRLIMAAIKQREVDERIELDDSQILAVLDKMAKQRRESIAQYQEAGRDDLVEKEQAELEVIRSYLPAPLSEAEIDALIEHAKAEVGAQGVRDMGKIMAKLKPQLQGRADLGQVSAKVKAALTRG
ncbi:GatB/YqeY domain-containing protein [Methylohalobius crimeensis]|uniref:GatB/YqeY domain-containing protein n=1 Tax=Methylohalobius crimeensis TaxID=244365 RepID=UPI0003B5B1D5|nr:GatB/YqeY domain-containing protein [Methylohalobius crimeensis]